MPLHLSIRSLAAAMPFWSVTRLRMFKIKLRNILDESKIFNIIMQLLIVASIIQVVMETMPSIKYRYENLWHILEIIFVTIFSLEYLLRIYCARSKVKFIFSFYGIIDLLAILPSILSFGYFDFRFLWSLRILRVFRVFKLMRYTKASKRILNAFKDTKEELTIFVILSMILLFVSSTGIYFFENEVQPETFKSIPHSFWWAVATLTTVGYGDIYPITVGGKIFTFFILMIGLGIISVPSGLFASAFSKNLDD